MHSVQLTFNLPRVSLSTLPGGVSMNVAFLTIILIREVALACNEKNYNVKKAPNLNRNIAESICFAWFFYFDSESKYSDMNRLCLLTVSWYYIQQRVLYFHKERDLEIINFRQIKTISNCRIITKCFCF